MKTAALLFVFGIVVACGGGSDQDPATPTPAPSSAGGVGAVQTSGNSGATAGTGAPSATGSTGVEACTLLTPAEVETAMGEAIAATRPESQGPTTMCTWDGQTTGRRYVTVIVRPAQFAGSVLENSFKNVQGSQPVDVGDEAYALPGVNTPDYRYLSAAAIAGGLYFQVNIAGPERSDADALDVVTETLRTVARSAP